MLVILLLVLAAQAQADMVMGGSDGLHVVAQNEQGEGLLLGQAFDEVDGLAVNAGVTFTLFAPSGEVTWAHEVSGDGNDKLERAIATQDGWVAVGSTSSSDLGGTWHEGWYDDKELKTDAWIIRLDAEGNTVWTKTFGGTDWDSFISVAPGHDGGWVAVGSTYSADGDVIGWHDSGELFAQSDGWVVCVDDQGELQWQLTLGGSGYDELMGIVQVPQGYMAVGVTDSQDGDVSGNLGDRDAWVVLIGKDGTLINEICYGGVREDSFATIAAGDDGWLAVGSSWSFDPEDSPQEDGLAVLLDENGDELWRIRFGGKGIEYPVFASFVTDFWMVTGDSVGEAGITDWVIAIHDSGNEWKLIDGKL